MGSLTEYRRRRHFDRTPEPAGGPAVASAAARPGKARRTSPNPAGLRLQAAPFRRRFSVQQHHATRLHYDLRLEMDGVLKSWAVPKGPTLDPDVRRLAMQTEDHPLEYLQFEGVIPEGSYGAGDVIVWDLGKYECIGPTPPVQQLERGNLKIRFQGKKLRGEFALVHMHAQPEGRDNQWLLIKKHDRDAVYGDRAEKHPGSVLRGLRVKPRARGAAASNRSLRRRRRPAAARKPPGRAELEPAAGASHVAATTAVLEAANAMPPAARSPLPEQAGPAAMPAELKPMLAALSEQVFSSPDWQYEIKWDGVRCLARIEAGQARLYSRSRREMTAVYPELRGLPGAFDATSAWLDGEIVALDAGGRSSFHDLQQRMNLSSEAGIQAARLKFPVTLYLFDLLYLDGYRLLRVPLRERRKLLRERLRTSEAIRYSDAVLGEGERLFSLARERKLEGIIAKRLDSVYAPGARSRDWLKFKLAHTQEAVILGYTDPRGAREHFGSLLLGVYESRLRGFLYIGRVGAGFDRKELARLKARLHEVSGPEAVIRGAPRLGAVHWTRPELVVEVRFNQWTPEGRLRAPVYLGLREDKPPRETIRESASPAAPRA